MPPDARPTIRLFEPGDLSELKAITIDAFDGVSIDRNIETMFGVVSGRDWRWRKTRHIDEDVQKYPEGVFVAELNGIPIGYVTTRIDADASVGYIPNLAVNRNHRGAGLGARLIQHALDHFRRLGVKFARIETLQQNAIGQNLYPSLGFREIARQVHYGMRLNDELDST